MGVNSPLPCVLAQFRERYKILPTPCKSASREKHTLQYTKAKAKEMKHILNITRLLLTMTLALLLSPANAKILQDETNASNPIKTLTLTTPQTHFTIKKVVYDGKNMYEPVYIPLKVMAQYSDGHSEEVTDKVAWKSSRRVRFDGSSVELGKGEYIISASLEAVTSNSVEIKVEEEDTTSKFLHIETKNHYKKNYSDENRYRKKVSVEIKLTKKPSSDVVLRVKLNKEDGLSFPLYTRQNAHNTHLTKELRFTPEDYHEEHSLEVDFDANSTEAYTLTTEPFESQDADYDGKNPEDIVLKKTKVQLIEPPIEQRRGAIRGVTIRFQVSSKESVLKYELIDPPKGMKIIGDSNFGYDFSMHGTDIEWRVPMDAQEGKTYHIKVKGIDFEGHSQTITFPIKVPKTKPIQTTLKNNELIVTDKSSPLFGMKMKGHSGEDVSALRLRSVEYGDVWRARGKGKHTVFVIYNKPPKLDIDLPGDLKNGLSKFRGAKLALFDFDFWEGIAPSFLIDAKDAWDSKIGRYIIKKNIKRIPQRNEYDDGGNKVYLLNWKIK